MAKQTIEKWICDVCKQEVVENEIEQKIPVLVKHTHSGYEWGMKKIDIPLFKMREIDVCHECLEKIVNVELLSGWYSDDIYKIIRKDEVKENGN